MKFFESEIVQEELEEINQLQQELYGKMMNMQSLSREERVDHIDNLKLLLEKQRVMYTRLSLSEDPEAVKLKKQLEQSVVMMGFPAGTDMQILFDGMKGTIENLESRIDI
jgi:hypothetical protein|tara:strand:+ start:114 stop:443 length:330 start_codon:yes stop_codon:yes gene_type:complete